MELLFLQYHHINQDITQCYHIYTLMEEVILKVQKGDYISLAHPNHKEVNIICGFWSEYLEYKNILLAQVWVEGYNKKMLDTLTIQVKSSKHGILKLTPKKRNKGRYSIFEERLYTTEIALDKKTDILKKVYDDVITIFVGGYKYELINPELILD